MPSVTDWINASSTIVLALITGYYAVITHRILAFQKKSLELEKRPFLNLETLQTKLFIDSNDPNSKKAGVQLVLRLKNVSKVLIEYKVTKIVASLQNRSIHQPQMVNQGGFLYPGQISDFHYDTFRDTDLSSPVIDGMLEYEIEYSSEKRRTYLTGRSFQLTFYTISKQLEWKTMKEEEREISGEEIEKRKGTKS